MKIPKTCKHNGKKYQYLSDDSRELDSHTLFVKTKRNAQFMLKDIDFIESSELKSLFPKMPKIIGITGTNGKTTTAAMIHSILLDLGKTCALLGTRGMFKNDAQIKPKGLTTPRVLELYKDIELANDCEFLVMEVSSHAIDQERIAGLAFIAKVLTNITSDHLDYHKTKEEYIRVKNSFLQDSGLKIINADEKNAKFNPQNAFTYGIENIGNLKVDTYSLDSGSLDSGILAHLSLKSALDSKQAILQTRLYGKHNLYNAIGAILCVKQILPDVALEQITSCLENFGGVAGRMEVISQNPLVIVDFAHTEDGMAQIFEGFKHKKISVIFGAGGDRDRIKRPKMGACAYKYAHRIYITSDNPRSENPDDIMQDIKRGIPPNPAKPVIYEADRKEAIYQAIKDLCDLRDSRDWVLLILGKGDENYQILGDKTIVFDDKEIALQALSHCKHSNHK